METSESNEQTGTENETTGMPDIPDAIDAAAAWQSDTVDRQDDEPFILQNTGYTPASIDETARRSGLAWSAGIVFFTSIAFMLFLGWIADILLGSSPWGLVGGILLGSIIGFIQFFRISSQIFEKNTAPTSPKTLFKDNDDRN